MKARWYLLAGFVLVGASVTGCASAPAPSADATPREASIAAIHVSKCGACHTRPDPRTRTREHLEEAFSRHRRRVRLTKDEWAEMLDYLAIPEGAAARQPQAALVR
jgi:hypothetical protein